ncbi:DNA repair and recombination protein RAD54B isoform X2 [Rhinoraja longicauda]
MRRSAAPSQLSGNAAKRFKFVPPWKPHNRDPLSGGSRLPERNEIPHESGDNKNSLLQSKASVTTCKQLQANPSPETSGNVNEHGYLETSKSDHLTTSTGFSAEFPSANQADGPSPQKQLKPSQPFAVPKRIFVSQPVASHQPSRLTKHNEENEPDLITAYYSVLWCKTSKKKHKKWEGDAILIVRKTSVFLKDTEGKDIGKGTGYKLKELASLSEGQTLFVSGKEIEIMGTISTEDFMSGRCFNAAATAASSDPSLPNPSQQPLLKQFTSPLRDASGFSQVEGLKKPAADCKPRHDPTAPNALVMPRPNLSHQWMFNKTNLPLVDVVVDPYLTIHFRPHQRDGVIFLYECIMGMRASSRFGAILADEMGLGKTLQCIALIWTLMRQGPYGNKPVIKKTLVVTPGSLVKNWVREFQKWLGLERLKVFAVDQDHKVEDFITSPLYPVLIISYEMLLRCVEPIQDLHFNLLICDEGHRLKNSSIKTSSAILSLSCEKRVILTGTPIQNDLQEFYSLVEFVNPGVLGSSSTYKKIYEEPIIRSQQPSAAKKNEKDSVKPDIDQKLEISPYRDLTSIFPMSYQPDALIANNSGKLNVLKDLLASIHALSPAERVVLVSNYTQTLDILQEMCNLFGYSYTRLDGQTPVSRRQQIVESFNSKHNDKFIFLLSSKAGGVGLNLIGASRLILYDIDWNPANDIQAMARIWRDGQRRPVHIYRLLTTGTIEEKIYQRQISKQSLSGTVVDMKTKRQHASFSLEELRNLFQLDEGSDCLTHDLLSCDCLSNGELPASNAKKSPSARTCQLGWNSETVDSKDNLSMSELMQWKHYSGEIQDFPDPYLERAKENITFMFQNTTKSQNVIN